mmetsp:Transcript_31642/g.122496  ORF Transcript_31642/g.122496 Transcript_31642/m.122496 type:complete len:261 (-) Transcript_31642:1052-1834(-)
MITSYTRSMHLLYQRFYFLANSRPYRNHCIVDGKIRWDLHRFHFHEELLRCVKLSRTITRYDHRTIRMLIRFDPVVSNPLERLLRKSKFTVICIQLNKRGERENIRMNSILPHPVVDRFGGTDVPSFLRCADCDIVQDEVGLKVGIVKSRKTPFNLLKSVGCGVSSYEGCKNVSVWLHGFHRGHSAKNAFSCWHLVEFRVSINEYPERNDIRLNLSIAAIQHPVDNVINGLYHPCLGVSLHESVVCANISSSLGLRLELS